MNASNSVETEDEGSIEQSVSEDDREVIKTNETFNQRIQELENALTEEKKMSEAYLLQIKYLKSDFDNYQKRVQREIERFAEFKSDRLIINLLEPLDELELAVEASKKNDNNIKGLVDGVNMVLMKLRSILSKEGVSSINAIGQLFDPIQHHAVATVPTPKEKMHNMIVNEIRKGYMLKDRVIRPSIVEVARLIDEESEGEKDD